MIHDAGLPRVGRSRPGKTSPQELHEALAAVGGNVAALQDSLDEEARRLLVRWSDDGIPPSAWTVSRFRIVLAAGAGLSPKGRGERQTRLLIESKAPCRGVVRVGIGFRGVAEGLADGKNKNR